MKRNNGKKDWKEKGVRLKKEGEEGEKLRKIFFVCEIERER